MKRILTGIFTLACILAINTETHGAHATNFLDALTTEVTNRIAEAGTNVTRTQRTALKNAGRTLNRRTRTLTGDLIILSQAAAQLNRRFPNDETFAGLQQEAVGNYLDEAQARLDGIELWIGSNTLSRSLSRDLINAERSFARAIAATSSVPTQARALASAFNRILPLEKRVQRTFNAPTNPPTIEPPVVNPPALPPGVPPGTPGLAADTFGTRHVNLLEDAIVNDQSIVYLSTASSGAQIYNVHQPEELGLWQYVRTGANTGAVIVYPNYPSNAEPREMQLTFTSATGGTWTGTTFFGEALKGTFVVVQ